LPKIDYDIKIPKNETKPMGAGYEAIASKK
jgi:hypothetical protein